MERIKNIGIVILIVLLILIAGLEGFYIIKSKEDKCVEKEPVTIYKGHEYLVENIQNELPEHIKLNNYTIINEGHTMVLDLSSNKDIVNSKIAIEYYDENNNLVLKDEQEINILFKDNEFVVVSNTPELKDKYSGNVKISMQTNDFNVVNYSGLDKSNLKLDSSTNVDPNTKELAINVKGSNPFSEKINDISGYVLLYEQEKIINIAYFNNEETIMSSSNFDLEARIYYLIENNEITYDSMKIVINYLY